VDTSDARRIEPLSVVAAASARALAKKAKKKVSTSLRDLWFTMSRGFVL
jgi:hypothetical protein